MKTNAKPVEPPSLSDLDGWKDIIRAGGLNRLQPEAVASIVQEIGPNGDRALVPALVGYISDLILNIIRQHVSKAERNQGEDIVWRAHQKLIVSLLTPGSNDGQALCVAFRARIKYRVADALRAERKYSSRNQPFETHTDDESGDEEIIEPADNKAGNYVEQEVYVERLLGKITDPAKRYAFRLHMLGMSIQPGKGTSSITQELGVSTRTAGAWITEAKALLKQEIGDDHD